MSKPENKLQLHEGMTAEDFSELMENLIDGGAREFYKDRERDLFELTGVVPKDTHDLETVRRLMMAAFMDGILFQAMRSIAHNQ